MERKERLECGIKTFLEPSHLENALDTERGFPALEPIKSGIKPIFSNLNAVCEPTQASVHFVKSSRASSIKNSAERTLLMNTTSKALGIIKGNGLNLSNDLNWN